jgi:AbiV family abortive infection protein
MDYILKSTEDPRRAGPITREEALDAIAKCNLNAQHLTKDAEALAAADARAAAGLAAIALEELGKVELLYLTATIDDPTSPQWAKFWDAWKAHGFKAGSAALMFLADRAKRGRLSHPAPEPRDLARTFTQLKERAWYVDIFAGGALLPYQMLAPEHVAWIVTEARRQADDAATVPAGFDAWSYDQLATHARGATTERELMHAQIAIAESFPDGAERAAEIRHNITERTDEYLNGSIFATKFPRRFLK